MSPVTMLGGEASRIGSPLRLGFGHDPTPAAGFAFNKTVWDSTTTGSISTVLLRGAQLDGTGRLYFGGSGVGTGETTAITVSDPNGGQMPFFLQLRIPLDSTTSFFTFPETPGCYAIQADSAGFSEVIVFKAI